MTVTLAKWTLDEYHQMISVGILENRRVELLHGKIVEMSPEGEPHAVATSETGDYLRTLLGDKAKIREAHPITLPNTSEPEPDLAIVVPPLSRYLAHHPYPEDIFWVMEFSDSSLEKDLGLKKQVYAEAGIQEYWVMNLQVNCLKVFRDPSPHGYQTELTFTEGTLSPLAFSEIQVEVKKLFGI